MKAYKALVCFLLAATQLLNVEASGACVGCVMVVSVLEQLAMRHKTDVPTATNLWCSIVASGNPLISAGCSLGLAKYSKIIQKDFETGKTPDESCVSSLDMCKDTPQCKVWKHWPPQRFSDWKPSARQSLKEDQDTTFARALLVTDRDHHTYVKYLFTQVAARLGIKDNEDPLLSLDIKELIARVSTTATFLELELPSAEVEAISQFLQLGAFVKPAVDNDKDGFSTIDNLRGAHWRGKDCDDADDSVYPGRRVSSGKPDSNCNGIPDAQEDSLCDVPQYGVVGLGDSATAHFSLPPTWLDPTRIENGTYANLINVLTDEADWPFCSTTTGHADESACPSLVKGVQLSSLYKKVRERNRCSHRDYQNIGVNGARSTSMAPGGIIDGLMRDPKADHPALVLYALIGNDVCNKSPDPSSMTPVDVFYAKTMSSLEFLDSTLPPNSHVLLGGLVDGRILFDVLGNSTHPIGTTYSDFYDFLNCVNISPCAGWMNSDPRVRDATTNHAVKLSNVYPQIVAETKGTFKNFDLTFIDYMSALNGIFEKYVSAGSDARALIEPTDGFHPSTLTNSLLAEHIWDVITHNTTIDIPTNPNNAKIEQLFGDQGGY